MFSKSLFIFFIYCLTNLTHLSYFLSSSFHLFIIVTQTLLFPILTFSIINQHNNCQQCHKHKNPKSPNPKKTASKNPGTPMTSITGKSIKSNPIKFNPSSNKAASPSSSHSIGKSTSNNARES